MDFFHVRLRRTLPGTCSTSGMRGSTARTSCERLTVTEFLRRVRRMVVGFVVSRLLAQDDGAEGESV